MSLNGLEAPDVNEAYQSAIAEGGGWLLLKYTTRDEVALLGRGNGGLAEVQEAVEKYQEQSPLFGFIQYRRRKVLLRYVPAGTSRLLQARVTVHFQSVAEKFIPHDTTFHFANLTELQDSALSSACSLHTATASIKSSNDSMRQTGLAGITEDVSESWVSGEAGEGSVEKRKRISPSRQRSRDSETRPEEVKETARTEQLHQASTSVVSEPSFQRARTSSNVDKALPPIPGIRDGPASERKSTEKNPPRSVPIDHSGYDGRPSTEGRMSSQSTRPSTRDLYDIHGFKQKVKLGPRPSTDSVGRSDHLEKNNEFRPVSTLPAGLRMPIRKVAPPNVSSGRPQSQQPHRTFHATLPEREKRPTTPITRIQIPDRRVFATNNGFPTPAKTPTEAKGPKITPEKRRLMKALQLRQKQLAAQKQADPLGIENVPTDSRQIKPEIDDSILNAITDATNPEADPDLVHVAAKGLQEDARNVESSPVSIPDTSDGPSTQASSITDEGDDVATNGREDSSNKHEPTSAPSEQSPAHDTAEDRAQESPKDIETETCPVPSTSAIAPTTDNQIIMVDNKEQESYVGEDKALKTDVDSRINKNLALDMPINTSETLSLIKKEPSGQDFTQVGQEEKLPPSADMPSAVVDAEHLLQETELEVPTTQPRQEVAITDKPLNDLTGAVHSLDHFAVPITEDKQAIPSDPAFPIPETSADEEALNSDPSSTQESHEKAVENEQTLRSHHDKSQSISLEAPLPTNDNEQTSFSSHNTFPQPSPSSESSPAQSNSRATLSENWRQSQDSDVTPTRPSTSDTIHEPHIRRHGMINPPERLSSPEHSDEHFLSDDSFMEELKCATVQEAKPVSVSKSPIKPVFPRSDSDQMLTDSRATRSVSSPLNEPNKDDEVFSVSQLPTPPSSRSFSANHTLRPDNRQQPPPQLPKKIGVSSGISQRIKALEQLSSRPSSPQSVISPGTSTSITQRKTSFRSPPASADLNTSFSNKSRPTSIYPSPSPSPEAVKSNPFNSLNHSGNLRPESVSVTATIVRDARHKTPETPSNPSEPRSMDLHPSPLVVEHQSATPRPLSPLKPPRPRYARYSSARSGSSSSTEHKVETPKFSRRDSFASMLSRSSRAGSEAELPRTLSDSSLNGMINRDENREEKKDSKRHRLMKRMSSISSMSRRSIANALSPSPKETSIVVERHDSIAETPFTSVEVGDVNIQFPDTLLWKRRHMAIDEQGILVLSPSKSDNNLKVMTKKFPLSDFRPPYVPDQDRQELPNSVILDFKDGSTLQCACEHPQGQAHVLQSLLEAHSIHQAQ
ncbi:hypothetical protein ACLMJK_000885 [Lecanora helva]